MEVPFEKTLKKSSILTRSYKRICRLQDFFCDFLSGFVGGVRLTYPVRVWYALALAALAMVNGPDSSRSHFNPNLCQCCSVSLVYFTPSGG